MAVKEKTNKGNLPEYLFHQGTNYEAQRYMGVHREETDEGYRYTFRVWAPKAKEVHLVSDFTSWNSGIPMSRITDGGIWKVSYDTPKKIEGKKYKFKIVSSSGEHFKSDPYAFSSETLGKTASVIHTESNFIWKDSVWLEKRRAIFEGKPFYKAPMNIYEMHLGSWRTKDGKTNVDGKSYLNYREIADELVPYLKKMGYTHAELLPIMEYPYDGSWGYQICSYYAPTSRFGSPEDFKYFVNKLHSNGIGVILDWVPAHFPKDEHGLYEFDGGPLYEFSGEDRMEHKEWGTRCFDVARNEVQCFLVSNALWWFSEYHVDGLRVDAVASMLYLDYGRKDGEWNPNVYGGNESLESIAFFKKLNTEIFARFPDVLMIAEESTAWPNITKPVDVGGLGFNFKWNMGWANDMYDYIKCDPYFRGGIHNKLTFSFCYAFSENFILPVSHDEVVHGKKSLLDKMSGNYDQKFATDRAFLAYQMFHPGKKLTFMGCEFGQFKEWDYKNQIEWFMLHYEKHAQLQEYVRKLNNFYLKTPALWEQDFTWEGFEWIFADLAYQNIIAFSRFDTEGNEVVVVINFSGSYIESFSVPVIGKKYTEVFNSDALEFGGGGWVNPGALNSKDGNIKIKLPALSALVFAPSKSRGSKTQTKEPKETL